LLWQNIFVVKNAVFWDVTPCGCCKIQSFGLKYRLDHQGERISELETKLAVTNETSVLTRATRRHVSEDGILHSHRRENLKSYIFLVLTIVWNL
jgi:hypothetical protein